MKNRNIDILHGNIVKNVLLYTLPLAAAGILQILYNMADAIVVAKFASSESFAAVSSNGALINLITNLFIGVSVGVSAVTAKYYGADDSESVSRTVHTSVTIGMIAGIVCLVIGVTSANKALVLMGTPDDVIGAAAVYLRIYFLGMPAMMLYNFTAAVLRAVGDTRRPTTILIISGLVNIALNLILVIVFKMDVAGVAVATVISQILSAVLGIYCLINTTDSYRFYIKKLRIYKNELMQVLRIGIPAGIQTSIFAISNVIIQSSINSFGTAAMAGSAAAQQIEGIVYVAMNSFSHACLAFTGQNLGAKNIERVRKSFIACIATAAVVGIIFGGCAYLFRNPLLSIFSTATASNSAVTTADILSYGAIRISIICTTYCLCGVMDSIVGGLRGIGWSLAPMIISISGVCGIRLVWIFTAFKWSRSLQMLFLSYPVSWLVTEAVELIVFAVAYKKCVAEQTAAQVEV